MALIPTDPGQRKRLLLAVLPLLGAFGYWNYVHDGRTAEIAALESRHERLESQNQRAHIISREAGPELQTRLARYEEHIERLEQLIPRTEEVSGLLYTVAMRAEEHGVELVRLEPEAELPGDYYTRQSYRVSIAGSYHDVGRFLSSIASLPRIITPVDLELDEYRGQTRPSTTRSGDVTLQATFRIRTYIVPSELNGGRPDARG